MPLNAQDPTPEQGASLIGQVIHDRFRVVAPIARGGMGAVYKAEQTPLGRMVALKVLSPRYDEGKDPEFRKRFFLEAATVAKLKHPNTVTVFDYGQSEGLFFIAMELLDGVTLRRAIRSDGPFEPQRAVHVAKQICRSLREAHRMGVIHRDMKPGNVMLLEQGDEADYVKVLDFGLVKAIEETDNEDLTQAGVFMGSPKYMSPEQIQGEAIDGRSDVYSVGVMLYEMLTGRPPFKREKQVQVLMDHIHSPVPSMSSEDGLEIPSELEALVLRCLAKEPDDRWPDMGALLQALKTWGGELPLASSAELSLDSSSTITSSARSFSGVQSRGSEEGDEHEVAAAPPVSEAGVAPRALVDERMSSRGAVAKLTLIFGALAAVAIALVLLLVIRPGDDGATAPTVRLPDRVPETSELPPTPEAPVETRTEQEDSPEEPAAPPSVLIELGSTPPGATVTVGERQYGPTPAQIELTGERAVPGTELTLVFQRAGYQDTTVTRSVPREGSLEIDAHLVRVRRTRRRARSGSRRASQGPAVATPQGYRDSPY